MNAITVIIAGRITCFPITGKSRKNSIWDCFSVTSRETTANRRLHLIVLTLFRVMPAMNGLKISEALRFNWVVIMLSMIIGAPSYGSITIN